MSKPAFDPNKPFEEAKPEFDPNQAFTAADEGAPVSAAADPSKIEALTQGVAQGGSLGYANELQAKSYPVMAKLAKLVGMDSGDDVDAKLKAQGFKLDQPVDTYESRLAENKARDANLKNSGYYTAGQMAGASVPGMLIPGGTATSFGGKTIASALAGGATGALQNTEDGESRTMNALKGLALGAAGQTAASSIGGALKAVKTGGGALKELAEKMAFKSTGAMLKDFRAADNKGVINDIGRFMIDKGLVKPGDTFESVADKAQELASHHSKILDDAYAKAAGAGEAALFKTEDVISSALSKAKEAAKGNLGGQQAVTKLENAIKEVAPEGAHMNAQEMREFTSKLGELTNWWDPSQPSGVNKTTKDVMMKAYIDARSSINSNLDKLANSVGGKLGDTVRASNKELSTALNIKRIAGDRVAREAAKNFIPLTDSTIGGAGGAAGFLYGLSHGGIEEGLKDAAIGASLGLGSKAARKYGRPIALTAADKAGDFLSRFSALGNVTAPIGKMIQNIPAGGVGAAAAVNPWMGVRK